MPPPPQTGQTFPLLDTMRAIGALCVLTTHTAFWAGDYVRHGTLGTVLARLDVGVAIFFVLSGFLLSRAWLARAADGAPGPATAPYFWKRALRIVPVYVITVVLALTFVQANDGRAPTRLDLDAADARRLPRGRFPGRAHPDVEPGRRGRVLRRAPAADAGPARTSQGLRCAPDPRRPGRPCRDLGVVARRRCEPCRTGSPTRMAAGLPDLVRAEASCSPSSRCCMQGRGSPGCRSPSCRWHGSPASAGLSWRG